MAALGASPALEIGDDDLFPSEFVFGVAASSFQIEGDGGDRPRSVWDDFADRVGYHAPGIPEDWKVRDIHPDIDSWNAVSSINASLTELGQVVCDVLESEYVDWEAEFEAPDDLPDF